MKETMEYNISVPMENEIQILPVLRRIQADQEKLGETFGFERRASSLVEKRVVYKLSFKMLHTLFSVACQLSRHGHKIAGEAK